MKFEHLTFPPQWKDYWTKYPHGMTILESLIDWSTKTNDLMDNVNNWNTYLNDFVATFDENLKQEVTETVQSWIDSGYIEVVISAALQTQIDDVELQLNNEVQRIDTLLAEKLSESNITTFYLMSAVTSISPTGSTDDMSVIKTMDNKIIVIDCGETPHFNYYDDKLTKMGVTKVDYFLVTHSHSDHIGNAPEFIAKYKPTHLYCREIDWNRLETESIQPEIEWRTKQFHIGMVNAAIANGVIIHNPTSGDVITLNDHEDITIIYDPIIDYNDYNNASMAFLYRNDLIKVLFLGDQLNAATNKLMSQYGKVDAVKLGHHGTAGTSNYALLNALKPKMAFLNSQDITRANDTCNRVRFFGVPYTNKDNEIIMFSISGNSITHNLKEYDNLNKQFRYWDGVDTDDYYFVKSNGKLAKDEFIMDGFDLKYFSESGQLWMGVGFIPVGNTFYYNLPDGTLAKNMWVLHTDGKYYYQKSDYKTAVSEQLWINGVVYTFDAGGTVTPIPTI